mgnify:FL=1
MEDLSGARVKRGNWGNPRVRVITLSGVRLTMKIGLGEVEGALCGSASAMGLGDVRFCLESEDS